MVDAHAAGSLLRVACEGDDRCETRLGPQYIRPVGESVQRVLRGGAYGAYARDIRSASRNDFFTPGVQDDGFGFRIARTIAP